MSGNYRGAGDGQCLALKKSDGERCTNGVYGSRLRCGHHMNASDVTLAYEDSDRHFYWCPECGFQPAEYGGGGEAFCSGCGVEFPLAIPTGKHVEPSDDFRIASDVTPEIKSTASDHPGGSD